MDRTREFQMPQRAASHPAPQEWLTEDKTKELKQVFGPSYSILNQGNLLNSAVSYWIYSQVTKEWINNNGKNYLDVLQPLREQWTLRNDPKKLGLSENELVNKLMIKHATKEWSRANWGHLGESLYLIHSPHVGKVTYGELAFSSKSVSVEIYHQLIAGEINFSSALNLKDVIRNESTGISIAKIAEFPEVIASKFARIKAPEYMWPFKNLDLYKIMYVKDINLPVYNEDPEDELLSHEFRAWVSDMLVYCLKQLKDQ